MIFDKDGKQLKTLRHQWYLPVPIVSKNNEILRWEQVRVHKYRLAIKTSKKDEPEKYDADTTKFLAEFGGKFSPFNNTKKDEKTW